MLDGVKEEEDRSHLLIDRQCPHCGQEYEIDPDYTEMVMCCHEVIYCPKIGRN